MRSGHTRRDEPDNVERLNMEQQDGDSWLSEGRCWICGLPADSAEHFIKASDLRYNWSRGPFAMRPKDGPAIKIPGPKSDRLKFRPSLCRACNGARTQRADFAWDEFNRRIQPVAARRAKGGRAYLPKLFGNGGWRELMLGVHLYWAKALGCYLAECGQRPRAGALRHALLSGTPCPTLQLIFFAVPNGTTRMAHRTALNMFSPINAAFFIYALNSIAVAPVLSRNAHPHYRSLEHWHPASSAKSIRLHELGAGDWQGAAERNAARRATAGAGGRSLHADDKPDKLPDNLLPRR